MLKNENGALPLAEGSGVSRFSAGSVDSVRVRRHGLRGGGHGRGGSMEGPHTMLYVLSAVFGLAWLACFLRRIRRSRQHKNTHPAPVKPKA